MYWEDVSLVIDNYPGRPGTMSLSTLLAKLYVKIYDQTTCVEFHKLLIATLIAYAKKHGGDIRAVYICSLLLWELTKSKAFQHHMSVLANAELLQLPRIDNLEVYLSFARDQSIPWDDKRGKVMNIVEVEAKATAMKKSILKTGKVTMIKIGLGWLKGKGKGKKEKEG